MRPFVIYSTIYFDFRRKDIEELYVIFKMFSRLWRGDTPQESKKEV